MAKGFAPITGATISVAATTSSGSAAFGAELPQGEFDVLVTNGGTVLAFVDFGNGAPTASAADTPIPGGGSRVLRMTNPQKAPITHVAAITATGTATVYFTPGHGGL